VAQTLHCQVTAQKSFFKLVSSARCDTIYVEYGDNDKSGGTLKINGIIVTHAVDDNNDIFDVHGVMVGYYATFIMIDGEISNNIGRGGCGVNNFGTFEMYEGIISNNIGAYCGGGVYNAGAFKMFGDEIINNTVESGGGVYSVKSFEMSGGTISGNTALQNGGGVCYSGAFNRSGGEISDNTADIDNDVT